MNNTGLELRLSDKKAYLILDGSAIPSTLDKNEVEYLTSLPHDTALYELLEHYLCNGWQTVDVALFGGLVLESPDGKYYADTQYAVLSAVDALLKGEQYNFYEVD
jgi:hypothetical protein